MRLQFQHTGTDEACARGLSGTVYTVRYYSYRKQLQFELWVGDLDVGSFNTRKEAENRATNLEVHVVLESELGVSVADVCGCKALEGGFSGYFYHITDNQAEMDFALTGEIRAAFYDQEDEELESITVPVTREGLDLLIRQVRQWEETSLSELESGDESGNTRP